MRNEIATEIGITEQELSAAKLMSDPSKKSIRECSNRKLSPSIKISTLHNPRVNIKKPPIPGRVGSIARQLRLSIKKVQKSVVDKNKSRQGTALSNSSSIGAGLKQDDPRDKVITNTDDIVSVCSIVFL